MHSDFQAVGERDASPAGCQSHHIRTPAVLVNVPLVALTAEAGAWFAPLTVKMN